MKVEIFSTQLILMMGLILACSCACACFESQNLALLRQIAKSLKALENAVTVPRVEFYTLIDGKKEKVKHMFLKVGKKASIPLTIEDVFGNAAKIDGLPVWSMTDTSLATLVVAEDGMSAELTCGTKIGSFKVQVSADADLGEGVKTIVGEATVDLIPEEAAVIKLAINEIVETPVEQPVL